MYKSIAILVALLAALLTSIPSARAADVTLTPQIASPGNPIPPQFIGLSFEMGELVEPDNGHNILTGDNAPLAAMFHSLGIRSLRIGGGSADHSKTPLPTPANVDQLYAFARAAGADVLFTVRMKSADPAGDARLAQYILTHYKSQTTGIIIGNEPDLYYRDASPFIAQWEKLASAISRAQPDVQFCGASFAGHHDDWTESFLSKAVQQGHFSLYTFHEYFGGHAEDFTSDPGAGRERILSPDIEKSYADAYGTLVPLARAQHLPYRLEETNSVCHGGAAGVSNVFAATLWGLDYMYWWAQHGSQGLNFHTHCHFVSDNSAIPHGYDTFHADSTGIVDHPLAYAMKAFTVTTAGPDTGRLVNVAVTGQANLTAYAVLHADKTLYLAIINREHGPSASPTVITIALPGYTSASQMPLIAPNNDVSATTHITLGGASINPDASWPGTWTPLPDAFHVTIPPASATVIRFTPS